MQKHKILTWIVSIVVLGSIGGLLVCGYFLEKVQELGKATQATAQSVSLQKHIAPDYLYPNPKLTKGKADTLSYQDLTKKYSGGQTYSQAHRAVSSQEKTQVCNEYPDNCKVPKEIDHFYPLCGGGSNDIANLWAQPETNIWNNQDWGFHTKDKLETYICAGIKKGTISPAGAFKCLVDDWIACYENYGLDKLGASNEIVE